MTHLSKLLIAATALLLAGGVGFSDASAAVERSGDGKNAYKLAAHNAAVRYDRDVAMWDCWDAGVVPRLSAWNGRRWIRWAVAEVSKDATKCPEKGTRKAVYRYHVSLKGRPVDGFAYNLVKVKEHCRGCETSRWTLPVLPPGAGAG